MNGLSLGCRQTLASYRLSRSASSLSRFARRKKLIAMSRDGLAASDRPTSGFQPMSTLRIGQAFLAEFGAGSGALPLSSLDCLRASAPKGVQNLAPHPQEPRLWSRSPDAVTRTAKQDELLWPKLAIATSPKRDCAICAREHCGDQVHEDHRREP